MAFPPSIQGRFDVRNFQRFSRESRESIFTCPCLLIRDVRVHRGPIFFLRSRPKKLFVFSLSGCSSSKGPDDCGAQRGGVFSSDIARAPLALSAHGYRPFKTSGHGNTAKLRAPRVMRIIQQSPGTACGCPASTQVYRLAFRSRAKTFLPADAAFPVLPEPAAVVMVSITPLRPVRRQSAT